MSFRLKSRIKLLTSQETVFPGVRPTDFLEARNYLFFAYKKSGGRPRPLKQPKLIRKTTVFIIRWLFLWPLTGRKKKGLTERGVWQLSDSSVKPFL